jgi:ABC-type multidrug transport system ATPase subunit
VAALRDVSLSLSGPSVIGLIGRNASGKTTLLRHIVGLQLPTRGQARTLGVATRSLQHEQLARIGVVPDAPTFIRWMSVREQLRYLSAFYPRWDMERQSSLAGLLDLDLLGGDARKPLEEIIDPGAGFDVLEQGPHGPSAHSVMARCVLSLKLTCRS